MLYKYLPAIVIFLGGIISGSGALWLAKRQSDRSDDMIALAQRNAQLSEENAAFAKDSADRAKENAALAKENAALSKQLVALVTGGDSYCYLDPTFNVSGDAARRGRADIAVFNGGKYPLYNIQLRVVDFQKFRQIIGDPPLPAPIPEEKLAPSEKMYGPIPRLDPGFGMRIGTWKLPDGVEEQDYTVTITAHNGMLHQFIRFRWVEGRWHVALQVFRGTEILKEQGAQWLSKDETGSPKWD